MALDTVAIAQTTPDNSQPFAELGLKPDEYCLLYTSPSPRDTERSRMPSSA